jgi:hypothetical protein
VCALSRIDDESDGEHDRAARSAVRFIDQEQWAVSSDAGGALLPSVARASLGRLDRGRSPLKAQYTVVLGLLVGAVPIHAALIACSSGTVGAVETSSADAAAPRDATVALGDGASFDDSGRRPMPEAGEPEQGGAAQPTEAATTDAGTDASDAGADLESGADAAPPPVRLDAGCSGVMCNGQCVIAPDCQGCAGAPLLCRVTGTCLADCAGCTAQPIECFACNGKHQNPLGTCEADNSADYCLNGNYAHAYEGDAATRCGCTTSSDCPGDEQVCLKNPNNGLLVCYTCGEAKSLTQGTTCKNGHTCVAAAASCR